MRTLALPQQIGNLSEERTAIAPYNFVPLPEQVVPAEPLPTHDTYHADRRTGRIACTLTTESPLYVRCALTLKQFEQSEREKVADEGENSQAPRDFRSLAKNTPEFFYTNSTEMPVIPGSSLRGMLRALVEIASFSKMEKVTDKGLVYRAVGDTTSLGRQYRERLMREDKKNYYTPLMLAGYIEQNGNGWQIRPAQQIKDTTFARIHRDDYQSFQSSLNPWSKTRNAFEIWVEVENLDYQPVRGGFLHIRYAKVTRAAASAGTKLLLATLAKSGQMNNKEHESVIFAKDVNATPISIPDDMVREYREQISKEQQTLLGKEGVLQNDQPVFYLIEEGRLVFFGHAMMFRIPYRLSPLDFVPEHLRSLETADIVEAMFGHVSRSNKDLRKPIAGRIFVSDARLEQGQSNVLYDEPLTPQILGSPKPTTFQHYLVQQSEEKRDLKHYASKPGEETVVRGHKLYWHKGENPDFVLLAEQRQKTSDTQLTQIRPVKPGIRFTFDIHFENLSDVELGALLWVLEKAADDNYRLKLGMGKPLGMGAVKIEHTLVLNDRKTRYTALFAGEGWQTGDTSEMGAAKRCLDAFHKHILATLELPNCQHIDDTLRIQCLLALLRWPGSAHNLTRYMEIERTRLPRLDNNRNEYKDRRVLPSPRQIIAWAEPACDQAADPQHSRGSQHRTDSAPQTVNPVQPAVKPKSAGPHLPNVGDVFTNLVLERDDNAVLVQIPDFPADQVVGLLPVDATTPKWKPGKDSARVKVVKIRSIGKRTIVELQWEPKVAKK